MLKEIAEKYFENFSNKNIKGLQSLLNETCLLIDWDVIIEGRNLILENNANFFNEVESLSVDVKGISELNDKVLCEIVINIDDISLEVVDVLSFDENLLIKKIHAYKSREISRD